MGFSDVVGQHTFINLSSNVREPIVFCIDNILQHAVE